MKNCVRLIAYSVAVVVETVRNLRSAGIALRVSVVAIVPGRGRAGGSSTGGDLVLRVPVSVIVGIVVPGGEREVLVRAAVAIIVRSVANLRRAGEDGRVLVITIKHPPGAVAVGIVRIARGGAGSIENSVPASGKHQESQKKKGPHRNLQWNGAAVVSHFRRSVQFLRVELRYFFLEPDSPRFSAVALEVPGALPGGGSLVRQMPGMESPHLPLL